MKRQQIFIASLLVLCSLLINQVHSQQLINNCALHYDVFDYYNPTVVRKICVKCQSTLTENYVLRYDFQECIRTTNFLDGMQNCQQLTLEGKCKQTLSNTTIVNIDNWNIVPQSKIDYNFANKCAQINSLGKCVYPVFPLTLSINPGNSDPAFTNNFECAFKDPVKGCQKMHYGFIATDNQQYFLFDFQNYEKLNSTFVSKLSDRLYCVKGYSFTESGCLQDGSTFPTIPNCVEQMGDYCYTCDPGYTLQNTRQSCQRIGDGNSCLTFEIIRGIPQCILCDNSFLLYRGSCYSNIAPSHSNIRFGSFCKAPYYTKGCTQVQKNLPLNCAIVDAQKGTCAQCSDVENQYLDLKSNSCKNRIYSIGCAVKHPVSDSCYVAYCQPGLRYRYPLPSFYPPTYTYVDAKYNNIWRNQFLASKQNITQNECIVDSNNPIDQNCKTYDQYGQSCILCKPNYWLIKKTDGTGYFNCSNDLTKFKTLSQYCLTFTPNRDRCTSCQQDYYVKSDGDCYKLDQNNRNCLIQSYDGNCISCREGYYPFQNNQGCTNQDFCWLKQDPITNSIWCDSCKLYTNKQMYFYNGFCTIQTYNDNCQESYYINNNKLYCTKCQPQYIARNGDCFLNFRDWEYTTGSVIKEGWDSSGYLLRKANQDITCQSGYVQQQCNTCSQNNCLNCIDDICYKCEDGYILNSLFDCVSRV
ncbi:hypothetical protein ABPG74_008066 [Tetrahymena malaccensis]